ncbi:hypothetical protein DM02DRAFT_685486 [Periconia macrospinosa]|uniref:Uncharacterized protein n=1 Tax=Periconia macrospinosa TaxID=97972 RepID=A0A2V1DGN2_9PLEO|nr:hypothetical protein DM02DRAFT_685486 [Periconia macrospinosa]
MAVVNTSWTSPPINWLSYKNCSAVEAWSKTQPDNSVAFLTDYLRSSLPSNLSTYPTDAQLLGWYVDNSTTIELTEWMSWGLSNCSESHTLDEFCKTYGSAGDDDLAGVGMFIAYQTEAALATIYAIAILFGRIQDHYRKSSASNSVLKRVAKRALTAFEESSVGFIDSAVIFSMSLQIASIVQTSRSFRVPDKLISPYTAAVSMMACLSSAFCAALLQCTLVGARRRKQRVVGWLLLFALVLSNLVLLLRLTRYWDDVLSDPGPQIVWAAFCDPQQNFDVYPLGYSMTAIFVVTVGWICLPISVKDDRPWSVGTLLRLGFAFTCVLSMWTLLGLITAWRADIIQTSSEINNEDQQWSFGQVLALAAWVPIIKEWGFLVIFPPEEALGGLMTRSYIVTSVRKSSEEVESDGIGDQSILLRNQG